MGLMERHFMQETCLAQLNRCLIDHLAGELASWHSRFDRAIQSGLGQEHRRIGRSGRSQI